MNSNTTNIAKDIFISLFQQKIYIKNITLGSKKVLTLQKTSLNFEKKSFRILVPDKF